MQTFTGRKVLTGGPRPIRVEYFENTGQAAVQLDWERLPDETWFAEFYNNRSLSGPPVYITQYDDVDFNWGAGSPSEVVNADGFSARFTRLVKLSRGTYRYSITVDDGARLWVDGRLLIDAWRNQEPTRYARSIRLQGGDVAVRLEYYEDTGNAVVQLRRTKIDTRAPSGEAVVVDDMDSAFRRGGSQADWHTESQGYRGRLLWSRTNNRVQPNYNWGQWRPSLEPGRYEVFAYIPNEFTTTPQARYWIVHAGQARLRVVDQSANGGAWVSLGTYFFDGSGNEYVSLADVTFESDASRLIAWDAVRWEPR